MNGGGDIYDQTKTYKNWTQYSFYAYFI